MAKDKSISSATLVRARDTKNTFVFKDDADNAPVPSLYVSKSAFKGDAPQKLKLTLEEA